MSIKLILVQSGEQIITDAREIISEEKTIAYLFKNPQKIAINKQVLALQEIGESETSNDQVQITISPWILLTSDEEIAVPANYVVTVVEPVESLKELYIEKTSPVENESAVSSDELEQLRGMYSIEQLQKLSEMYSPEELEELKAMYFGNKNGTNDQVSSTEE